MLAFKKSKYSDNWYYIEDTGVQYSVEGDAQDMLQIAKAIREKSYYYGSRCAIDMDGDEFCFECPRSSEEGFGHRFTHEEVLKIAAQIEQMLSNEF